MKSSLLISGLLLFLCANAMAGPGSFLTRWVTTNGTITIPVTNSGAAYIYNVTWTNLTNAGAGDGSVTGHVGNYTITGLTNGNTYEIEITGNFSGFYFNNGSEKDKIRTIERWGEIVWTSMANAFYGCTYLTCNATDFPDVSQVTTMTYALAGARQFNADLSGWDVSNVTTMRYMFFYADSFNQSLNSWNVSNVTDMSFMFYYAEAFNQNLDGWDVSKVTNMSSMFDRAGAFNGDVSSWNVGSVTNMSYMFSYATVFNQDLNSWNMSNVTNIHGMFHFTSAFNQDLNNWNVSNVTNMTNVFDKARAFNGNISNWDVSKVISMSGMFSQADDFNQDVSGWDVGNVTDMSFIFDRATLFNQDLNNWDVSKVTNLTNAFAGAESFNQNLDNWNVSNVTQMGGTFRGAFAFNGDISTWDVSKVTTMNGMLGSLVFNGDLSSWNVSNVTDMTGMFSNAQAFNQDISSWDVSKVTLMPYMFSNAKAFNQPLNTWNVGNVTNMREMFFLASAFNQDLNTWNTSKVTNMARMFYEAVVFNQDLNNWDVSKVTDMRDMFIEASAFNGNISNWNVSSVTNMSFMFQNADAFNGNISSWNVGEVTNMEAMFDGVQIFNQNLNSWNVSKVTGMRWMFNQAVAFNQPLNNWNVSSVNRMDFMFAGASSFDQDLNAWNVGNVDHMENMFNNASVFNRDLSNWNVSKVMRMDLMFNNASAFNQDISAWNVSKVTNMSNMFNGAIAFNQNLDKWNISNVTNMSAMLNGTAISIANYDAILQGWATLDAGETKIPTNVQLGAAGLFYTTTGQVPRTSLDITRSWTITGDALVGAPLLPTITGFTPTSGPIGTTVTITGTNFSTAPANNIVFFGATQATVTAATATQLTVTVPFGATYEPIVVITNGLVAYSSKPFIVTFPVESITTNSFGLKTDFATNDEPTAIAIGDWDGDGKADMVVATIIPATGAILSVYRNTSTGPGNINFATKLDFNLGPIPALSIATGDFDGDGKLDLATSNWSAAGTISFFRNISTGAGNINFATGIEFPAARYPASLCIGDLDRDGKADVAVTNVGNSTGSTGNVFVYRNTSTGPGNISFATKIDFVTGGFPESIAMSDQDGDGKVDLATGKRTSGGFVMRNTSTGPGNINFAGLVNFTTGNSPYAVSIGDIDGDGKADIVTPNRTDNTISVLRNTSTGPGNISYAANVNFPTGENPIYTFASDLDGDGNIDFVTANQEISVSVLRNTSTSGSISFDPKTDFTTGDNAQEVSVVDMDGDGKPEIVTVNREDNTISVLSKLISSSPTITSFAPALGPVGTTVTITGTNFSTTPANNTVQFNGTTSTVTASTATSITTTVPVGATTGQISVTVSGNTATSSGNFTVLCGLAPAITSFSPSSGTAGTTVIITGTNFSTTPEENIVDFNGTVSAVSASTATSITTIVPTGASGTGPISVAVGCNTTTSTDNFTVICSPAPTITSFSPTSGTTGTSVTITGTNFSTTPANNLVDFNGVSAVVTSATATSITAEVPAGATPGPIAITIECNSFTSATNFDVIAIITITSQPGDVIVCEGEVAIFSATATGADNITYQWQYSPDGISSFTNVVDIGVYSGATTSTLSVNTSNDTGAGHYRCSITGDLATPVVTDEKELLINARPSSPVGVATSRCSGSITLEVSGGTDGQYKWYTVPTDGTAIDGEVNSTYTTPVLSVTTIYYATITSGDCESQRTPVTATIIILPASPVTTGASACPGSPVTLTASGGINGQYKWYDEETGGTAFTDEVNDSFTTPELASTTTYYVTFTDNGCESLRTPVTATILTSGCAPVITNETLTTQPEGKIILDLKPLISTAGTLDINSITITEMPASGALAVVENGILTIDYMGISFSGTESIVIEACNTNGICSQQNFSIEVAGDIIVYNAMSPNGDDKNPILRIQFIDLLPETKTNKVFIYNRWGDEVFSVADYDNKTRVFAGLTKDGIELPSGIYFYKIILPLQNKTLTGFIDLRF